MRNQEWEDPELGRMVLRVNSRAKRILYRVRQDAVYVTVPQGASEKDLMRSLEELRGRLVKARKQIPAGGRIDWNYKIDVPGFRLDLREGGVGNVHVEYRNGQMTVWCPADTDFADTALQDWLKKVVERGLKLAATPRLKARLEELARQTHLSYRSVCVNVSKSRWGSCSTSGAINLSCYILLLPPHLADYVLLHELTHTVEMNHSERFWALLDQLTGGCSRQLRQEIRQYHTGI